jgi:hypothetical protein
MTIHTNDIEAVKAIVSQAYELDKESPFTFMSTSFVGTHITIRTTQPEPGEYVVTITSIIHADEELQKIFNLEK